VKNSQKSKDGKNGKWYYVFICLFISDIIIDSICCDHIKGLFEIVFERFKSTFNTKKSPFEKKVTIW
jgi:hypothetical protein